MRRVSLLAMLLLATAWLVGCGYNEIERDEEVRAAWAEVLNQYQRRADLVPNLVSGQGLRARARMLHEVVKARASVRSIQARPTRQRSPKLAFERRSPSCRARSRA